LRNATAVRAGETFARCNASLGQNIDKHTRKLAFIKTFLIFVSEMGRQNEKSRARFTSRASTNCAMQKIVLTERRLVLFARFLRCAGLDAAMHNRNPGTDGKLRSDFEATQHPCSAAAPVLCN
jgi:hypothetical protein